MVVPEQGGVHGVWQAQMDEKRARREARLAFLDAAPPAQQELLLAPFRTFEDALWSARFWPGTIEYEVAARLIALRTRLNYADG